MSETDTQRRLALLFLFVFIDVPGLSLVLPLLPYYADTFDATESVVGQQQAANALTQLVGAPVLGRLSDRYGRRPLLIKHFEEKQLIFGRSILLAASLLA